MKKVEIEKINIDSDTEEEKVVKSKASTSRQPTVEKLKQTECKQDEELSQKSESQHLDSRF